jgi:DNA-binding IclR family transcriptional regulator
MRRGGSSAPRGRAVARNASASARGRRTIGAVAHAIEVLRCISEAGNPIGVGDIARRIGIHKSSVSRLATTLENGRLVARDPATGRLSLGTGLVALAAPVLAGFHLPDLVRPLLEQLAAKTGETVSFSIWDGAEAVSIAQVPGSNSVQAFSTPGHRNPAHGSASGKMLLAHMGEQAIAAYCAKPLRRFTERTITDPAILAKELARYRSRGYAINTGEFEIDVGAVSSAVFDRRSHLLGTVTATVPMYRFAAARRTRLAKIVRTCAAELSAKLRDLVPRAG